jgi:sulfite reductase (NADPH) hemoprotein beta-component
MTPEQLKLGHPNLAGTIAATLANAQVDRFPDDDATFLKFHGVYQGDDRDLRKTGKKHIFMVRCRIPGGIVTPSQYLALDDLATRYANNTLRVTSRQGLQFHGVVKSGLGPLVKEINVTLLTTLSACGDVNRNVMAPPAPAMNGLAAEVREHARQIAAALAPRTPAYHAIWIDGVQLNLNEDFTDPLYGKTYLPRKFKIGFAIPPHNDVDIFTHCCGFIAIADTAGKLTGYNLVAGGGMGRSHGNKETFPRLADVIGFLPAEFAVVVARAALTIHRDFGDRTNRKHARLKYILADRGPHWFRAQLEQRTGFKLAEAKPVTFTTQGDSFGWHMQADGRLFLSLFVETGRIKGDLKTALRTVIGKFQPEIRLTPGNNVILANITPADQPEITRLLAGHGGGTALRRASMACVALPTCGLAVAESERYLPSLITDIDALLAEVGLRDEEIVIRMTGCPNGCARPYMAEIGFVGKSPGLYQIWLGGNVASTRLNKLYRESVKDAAIVSELRPLLTRYAKERQTDERFGDWCVRAVEFP